MDAATSSEQASQSHMEESQALPELEVEDVPEMDAAMDVPEGPNPLVPADQIQVRTTNVVASVKFCCLLDLIILYSELGVENCKYVPSKFHGLIFKCKSCTMNIYSNGSVLCTGAKNVQTARKKLINLGNAVRKIGFDVCKNFDIKICNLVGCFSLSGTAEQNIKLMYSNSRAFLNFSQRNVVVYAPDRFCAMTWYYESGVAIVAFRSGRCIVTGCTSYRERGRVVEKFIGERMF